MAGAGGGAGGQEGGRTRNLWTHLKGLQMGRGKGKEGKEESSACQSEDEEYPLSSRQSLKVFINQVPRSFVSRVRGVS